MPRGDARFTGVGVTVATAAAVARRAVVVSFISDARGRHPYPAVAFILVLVSCLEEGRSGDNVHVRMMDGS